MTARPDGLSTSGSPDCGRFDDQIVAAAAGDPIETQLREYYEAEAAARLRPDHGERRRSICDTFAAHLAANGIDTVLDVGSGPASDQAPFRAVGVRYVGVDLAIGNASIAAESGSVVVPGSLFSLPLRAGSVPAGWSMSTFQHVPDERIDEALAEFVRVLQPGAPVVVGLWGGRDEVIESEDAKSGLQLPRHFTLRTHERIRSIVGRHLIVERDETFGAGPSDWEYHVSFSRTPPEPGR